MSTNNQDSSMGPASGPGVSSSATTTTTKPQRILACLICQQRKVKCNRTFPCTNCIKAGTPEKCIPAALIPRTRRRRFPERELLDHIKRCEDLLRRHDIDFTPLHGTSHDTSHGTPSTHNRSEHQSVEGSTPRDGDRDDGSESGEDATHKGIHQREDQGDHEKETTDEAGRTIYDASDVMRIMWDMNKKAPSLGTDTSQGEKTINEAFKRFHRSKNQLLFGLAKTHHNLASLHPRHADIFKLWQLYLDNVNPILKVTHTPTLQTQLIQAIGHLDTINPELEAVMFSIYSVALSTISDGECLATFGTPKNDMLVNYQFACQQALLNCGFLWTSERDCLTAFFLYLVSLNTDTDHRAVCSLMGIAVRLAQRLGMHEECHNVKCPPFEAEMRRRLWWSMATFDNRIGETSLNKMTMLSPDWDCKIPLNVNDFDLRPDMKSPPANETKPTEAFFVVVRAALGDALRHSSFHLEFTRPALFRKLSAGTASSSSSQTSNWNPNLDFSATSPSSQSQSQSQPQPPNIPQTPTREMSQIEKRLHEKYLSHCNTSPDSNPSPLQCLTLWTTQSAIAKNHLLEQHLAEKREKKSYRKQQQPHPPPSSSSSPQQQQQHSLSSSPSPDDNTSSSSSPTSPLPHVLQNLQSDTLLMSSPQTRTNFLWFVRNYFPFPAYVNVVQHLQRQLSSSNNNNNNNNNNNPTPRRRERKEEGEESDTSITKTWKTLALNFEARFIGGKEDDNNNNNNNNMATKEVNPLKVLLLRPILGAWEERRRKRKGKEEDEDILRMVRHLQGMVVEGEGEEEEEEEEEENMTTGRPLPPPTLADRMNGFRLVGSGGAAAAAANTMGMGIGMGMGMEGGGNNAVDDDDMMVGGGRGGGAGNLEGFVVGDWRGVDFMNVPAGDLDMGGMDVVGGGGFNWGGGGGFFSFQ